MPRARFAAAVLQVAGHGVVVVADGDVSREWRASLVAAGLLAESAVLWRVRFAPFQVREAWLAALTLVIVGAAGLIAWLRVPGSRVGPWLVAAAVTWGLVELAAGVVRPGALASSIPRSLPVAIAGPP